MMGIPASSIIIATALGLFAVGLIGIITIKNIMKLVVALQIMIKGALLALVWAARGQGDVHLGQSIGMAVIVADTIVAVLFLALVIQLRMRTGSLDITDLTRLRR